MEEGEADRQAASSIPRADREAFTQIATAAGIVRARAALVLEQRRPQPGATRTTAQAYRRTRTLAPRDARLLSLRDQTLRALRRASQLDDRRAAPTTARALITTTTTITAGLQRYARNNPAIGNTIPD